MSTSLYLKRLECRLFLHLLSKINIKPKVCGRYSWLFSGSFPSFVCHEYQCIIPEWAVPRINHPYFKWNYKSIWIKDPILLWKWGTLCIKVTNLLAPTNIFIQAVKLLVNVFTSTYQTTSTFCICQVESWLLKNRVFIAWGLLTTLKIAWIFTILCSSFSKMSLLCWMSTFALVSGCCLIGRILQQYRNMQSYLLIHMSRVVRPLLYYISMTTTNPSWPQLIYTHSSHLTLLAILSTHDQWS